MAQAPNRDDQLDALEHPAAIAPGSLTNANVTTFEVHAVDDDDNEVDEASIHLPIEWLFYLVTGATAPSESVARSTIIATIKDAVKVANTVRIEFRFVAYAPGKVPAFSRTSPNPCVEVIITNNANDDMWPANRASIMSIDWEAVKIANFGSIFRRPRTPKAQWDAGAASHFIAYMGIPVSCFHANHKAFITYVVEQANAWGVTPFFEVFGGQICIFFKFADEDTLAAAFPEAASLVDQQLHVEFFATSSMPMAERTLVLGHIAHIPDANKNGSSWWKFGIASSTKAICAFFRMLGVAKELLPSAACPVLNNGLLEACLITFANPDAAQRLYARFGWDTVQVFGPQGSHTRAAVFKFPSFIGNQKGYFADRRVLKVAAPQPAAAKLHINRPSAPASPAAAGNGAEEGEIAPAAAAALKRSRRDPAEK